nr:OmpA family protein [uncultured Desulfuromonas sp.]
MRALILRCATTIFFLLGVLSVSCPAFDVTFDNVTKKETKQIDYYQLKVGKKNRYGLYRETKYTFKDKLDSKQRNALLQQNILTTLQDPSVQFDRFGVIEFEHEGDEYTVQLASYANSATLKELVATAYTPFITLDARQWPLNKKLALKGTDAPLMPLTPLIQGAAIKRLVYKNYDEQIFRVAKKTFPAQGRYWRIEYGLDKYTKNNSLRFRATHNYRDLLKNRGATIHSDDDGNGFVFELDLNGKQYVGLATGYDNSFNLDVVESEAFQQTLILSPDKLKAELDAKGKVTLEGIYFDTDKATLKPQSDRAITAAASLLRHYDDLVLEVQGHTDNQGDDGYNHDLSQRRAQSVVEALINEGTAPQQLKARGFGEERPVADNNTEQGRAQNRRVELHRLSGGDAMTMIDIDFIKPLPGAQISQRYHYDTADFVLMQTPPYNDKKSQEKITGYEAVVYHYKIIKNDKRDTSFGRVEIMKNYTNILPLQSAELLGADNSHLHFTFKDRGEGRCLYGIIKAYDGAYELWVYIQPAQPQEQPAETHLAPQSVTESAFLGIWHHQADRAATITLSQDGRVLSDANGTQENGVWNPLDSANATMEMNNSQIALHLNSDGKIKATMLMGDKTYEWYYEK